MAEVQEATALEAEVPVVPAVEPKPEKVEAPRSYSQEEVDRITAKVKKNAAYRARKEAEAYFKGLSQGQTLVKPAETPKPAEEKAPVRGDFDSYEEFMEAKAAFVGKKAAREDRAQSEAEARQAAESQAKAKSIETFQSRTREKYPDLEERIESISHIVMPPGMGEAIAESEFGPDIVDFFAKNPKECERIASLTPPGAIREIGKLEARLEKPAEPAKPVPVKPASKAPEPIKPGGGGSPADTNPKDTDSIDDWMRKENARGRRKNS